MEWGVLSDKPAPLAPISEHGRHGPASTVLQVQLSIFLGGAPPEGPPATSCKIWASDDPLTWLLLHSSQPPWKSIFKCAIKGLVHYKGQVNKTDTNDPWEPMSRGRRQTSEQTVMIQPAEGR